MTKLYRENVATTGWFLPVVENFVLGRPEVENFASSAFCSLGGKRSFIIEVTVSILNSKLIS